MTLPRREKGGRTSIMRLVQICPGSNLDSETATNCPGSNLDSETGTNLSKMVPFGRVAVIVWHQRYHRGSTRHVDVEKWGGGGRGDYTFLHCGRPVTVKVMVY